MKYQYITALLLSASMVSNAIGQELVNGGFEDYQRGWNVWGAALSEDAYSGLSCLYIENEAPAWKGADQIVQIPAGTVEIQLQGYVRLEEVDLGAEPYEMARLGLEFQDAAGKMVGKAAEPACEEFGSIKWLKYKRKYKMREGAAQLKITAALANTSGKVWFDDIDVLFKDVQGKIITNRQPAYTIITNGDFEQGGDGWAFFGGRIAKGGRNDGLCMKISQASPNWIFANQEIALPKGAEYIEVSGFAKGDVSPGANSWEIGRITADFINKYGNKVGGDQKPAVEVSGQQDWSPFKKKYRVAYGATSVRIECALGNATGAVLFDDIRVRVVDPDEKPQFEYQQYPLVNGNVEGNGGWSLWGAKIDDGGRNGGKCLHASSEEPIWLGASQIIGIPRGVEKVIASGWIKTDNLVPGSDHYMKGRISMEFQDHNEQMTGGYQDVVGDMVGTNDWKHFTHEYKIPEGAYFIKMDCALGNSTGHVYFDDLQLEYIKGADSPDDQAEQNEYESPLANGGFEKGIEGWAALGNKVAESVAKTGTNAMQVGTDGAEEPRVFQDMMLPKDVAAVEFTGSIYTPKGQSAVSGTVSIIYFTPTRDIIANNEFKISAVTEGQWRDLEAGEPVPEGAEIVRIEATNNGQTDMYIDDFSIVFRNEKGEKVAKSRDVVKFN